MTHLRFLLSRRSMIHYYSVGIWSILYATLRLARAGLTEHAAHLTEADYQQVAWRSQEAEPRQVWVHLVQTRVKKLYRCPVLLVKETRDAPVKQVRYFASSDLVADAQTLVAHLATGGGGALCGRERTAGAGSIPGDERGGARARLRRKRQCNVTLGEAWREVQRRQWHQLITWMHQQFVAGTVPQAVFERLAA